MLWKHYGPDSNGIYGGLNGVGGLEAVQDEAGTVYEPNAFAANAYGWGLESLEKSAGKAFAEVLAQNNWHSRRLDPTGLIYMGHRYYSPVLGSFISQDPLGHDTSPGLYDFAYGDPVNYFDTNGLFASKVYQKTGTFIAENLDNIQTSLDAAGMTPGIGNVADIANAAISGARGDLKGMGMRAMAAVPVAGIAVGSALLLDKAVNKAAAGAKVGSGAVNLTPRAARREVMRQAGIPTSQQPLKQISPKAEGINPVGRQYTYEVPKKGGGREIKSVQHSLSDRVPGHGPHWEAGTWKKGGQLDSQGRIRIHGETKVKINE